MRASHFTCSSLFIPALVSAVALTACGAKPKQVGGELGVTMVLHTWTRELHFHPHVHAIVTGGGLSDDDTRWVRARKDFLFPVRVMGALFRGKMLAALPSAPTPAGSSTSPASTSACCDASPGSSTPSAPSAGPSR